MAWWQIIWIIFFLQAVGFACLLGLMSLIGKPLSDVEGFEFVWITDGIGWKSAKKAKPKAICPKSSASTGSARVPKANSCGRALATTCVFLTGFWIVAKAA